MLLSNLEHLVSRCLVAIVALVIPVVGGGWSETEHMTEYPDNPKETFCLDFKVTGQTELEQRNRLKKLLTKIFIFTDVGLAET